MAIQAIGGDPAAFATLVERYRRYLYAVAYRIVLHEDDALDVVQETFVSMARHLTQWQGRGTLRAWLAVIATRQALDLRSHSSNRHEQPTDPQNLERILDASPSTAQGPIQTLETQERRHRVKAAMGELSPQQRAILSLRLAEDQTPAEIAERLGLPPSQVRSQLARAVARLREILSDNKARP